MLKKNKMSESIKHWAEDLQIGDRVIACIRHKTDGSKNIHGATVIVVENDIYDWRIVGWYCEDTISFKVSIRYGDLRKHEVSKVECNMCGYEWTAVRHEGLTKLQCPNCLTMIYFDNL